MGLFRDRNWEARVEEALDRVEGKLDRVLSTQQKQEELMPTIQDIAAAVTDIQGTEDSVVALLDQLHAELAAANANNDPAAVQAVLDQIAAQKAALAAAVAANS